MAVEEGFIADPPAAAPAPAASDADADDDVDPMRIINLRHRLRRLDRRGRGALRGLQPKVAAFTASLAAAAALAFERRDDEQHLSEDATRVGAGVVGTHQQRRRRWR